tara:strand:- start:267 stop:407 length:141 start_codon:yes stop_codon:yes gene_type:complete
MDYGTEGVVEMSELREASDMESEKVLNIEIGQKLHSLWGEDKGNIG